MEIKRKLASIQKIAEIKPIEGADAIEAVRVLGWWVVAKKSEFKVGDLAVYLTIDSWVPHDLAPFLSKGKEPREYNGVKGEKLRTVKLRGQVSQGLLLKPTELVFAVETKSIGPGSSAFLRIGHLYNEGEDLTEILGIQKWEAPIPAQLHGKMKGNFPSWARKTDQERAQNIWDEIYAAKEAGVRFEVTVKLDGSSCSIGMSPDNEYTVCSRNLSLQTDQEGNSFVLAGRKYGLEEKLAALGRPLMISGELMGPNIQGNQENLKEHELFVFDVFDPRTGAYVTAKERKDITEKLGLNHALVLHDGVTLDELGINTLDDLLKFAEGPSINSPQREGVVFKSIDGSFSFKAISNKWLIRKGE